MEILINSMPVMSPATQLSPRSDFDQQDASCTDKNQFASFVHKEQLKAGSSKSCKEDVYSAGPNTQDTELHKERISCNECQRHINHPIKNTRENDGRQDTEDIELPNENGEHPGNALKTGALLFTLMHDHMTESGSVLNNVSTHVGTSGAISIGLEGTGDALMPGTGSGLKNGTMLHGLVSSYVSETGEGFTPDPESNKQTGLR
ncbi:MAG TPA: hypothetical protein DDX85_05160, partial [Nitrospiraceae bacterium]|nr:hypothetical protein [Nitrospiraceae bacterium]